VSFAFVQALQRKKSRPIKPCITAKLRTDEFNLPDADRLRPFFRLDLDVREESPRWAEHATAENDLLRIKQADEVCHSHAPEFNGLGQHFFATTSPCAYAAKTSRAVRLDLLRSELEYFFRPARISFATFAKPPPEA
jgi:hypothetical protein